MTDEAVVHAMAVLKAERRKALRRTITTHKALRKAQREYEDALLAAHAADVPHSEVARALGLSETSVRLFIKRRKDKRERGN